MTTPVKTKEAREMPQPARAGRWPDFIIIGAMKAGTTTLFELLCRHPRIFMCEPKEPMFFSRDEVYRRGPDWYRARFADAAPEQLCGEASTCYSRWPHFGDVPARIHDATPDVKIIYMLRHPVERAYSHYAHNMRFEVSQTFEQALEHDEAIIDASMYLRQIEQYLRLFPREQMLIVTLDDFSHDPDEVMDRVRRFLEIEPADLLTGGPVAANRAGDVTVEQTLSDRMHRLRHLPGIKQLADLCPRSVKWWFYRRVLRHATNSRIGQRIAEDYKGRLSPLSDTTRRRLLQQFEQPTRDLERFLDRPLPDWFK